MGTNCWTGYGFRLAALNSYNFLNFNQVCIWICPKQSMAARLLFLVIHIQRGSFLFIRQVMSQHKEVCPFFFPQHGTYHTVYKPAGVPPLLTFKILDPCWVYGDPLPPPEKAGLKS